MGVHRKEIFNIPVFLQRIKRKKTYKNNSTFMWT